MDIIWYKEPWEHFEVRNFLTTEELKEVREFFDTLPLPDGKTGENEQEKYRLNRYVDPENFHSRNDIDTMIQNRFIDLLKSVGAGWNAAKDEIHLEYDRIFPGFDWPIHNDLWTKRVSFILHVSDTGHGTRLYENHDGSGRKRTVNWLPGGGGGFVRDDHTHHSFDTLEDTDIRKTVILTSRIKGADWRTPPK